MIDTSDYTRQDALADKWEQEVRDTIASLSMREQKDYLNAFVYFHLNKGEQYDRWLREQVIEDYEL